MRECGTFSSTHCTTSCWNSHIGEKSQIITRKSKVSKRTTRHDYQPLNSCQVKHALNHCDIISTNRVTTGTPTNACEMMSRADLWLMRNYWDFDFPRPFLPNFIFLGGVHCQPAKPLPKVRAVFNITGSIHLFLDHHFT